MLVFGENRRTHERNLKNRVFKLGPAKVKELCEYDHVGMKTSIFSDSTSGIEERVRKARRALNAISGEFGGMVLILRRATSFSGRLWYR